VNKSTGCLLSPNQSAAISRPAPARIAHPYVCVRSRELSQSDLMDDIVGSTEASILEIRYFIWLFNLSMAPLIPLESQLIE